MMARVREKFARVGFVHGVVEDIVRGVEEDGEISEGEGLDGEHKRFSIFVIARTALFRPKQSPSKGWGLLRRKERGSQ